MNCSLVVHAPLTPERKDRASHGDGDHHPHPQPLHRRAMAPPHLQPSHPRHQPCHRADHRFLLFFFVFFFVWGGRGVYTWIYIYQFRRWWGSWRTGDIPAADAGDVELAVAAARRAFAEDGGSYWSRAPGAYRAGFLRAIASKVCSCSRNALSSHLLVGIYVCSERISLFMVENLLAVFYVLTRLHLYCVWVISPDLIRCVWYIFTFMTEIEFVFIGINCVGFQFSGLSFFNFFFLNVTCLNLLDSEVKKRL